MKLGNTVRSVLVIVLASTLVEAKAASVRVSVTGPTLPHSIEITSGQALAIIWAEDFLGAPAVEPDKTLPTYTVSFFAERAEKKVELVYVVTLVLDRRTDEGFIYLPGRGEDGYRLNTGSILRNGQDGKWHHAPNEWCKAITDALPK
jgi:hypothetical protein